MIEPVRPATHARRTGTLGIWSIEIAHGDPDAATEHAAELERLGFAAVWLTGGLDARVLDRVELLLRATSEMTVFTAGLSIWSIDAAGLATRHRALRDQHGPRFASAIGVSHAPLVEQNGGTYTRPLAAMRAYLDDLAGAPDPLPSDELLLAAQGPQMLALARDRTFGAHPLIVTPEHTRRARAVLGEGRFLAPGQKVVFESDSDRARAVARASLEAHLALPNYTNNLRRLGFTDHDLAVGGSDELIDALVAWGGAAAVRARIDEHFAAGADHVAVEVLTSEGGTPVRDAWHRLAESC